jgi:hypothetical protein
MEPITVATIVALVFQTTVEKFTEAALEFRRTSQGFSNRNSILENSG